LEMKHRYGEDIEIETFPDLVWVRSRTSGTKLIKHKIIGAPSEKVSLRIALESVSR